MSVCRLFLFSFLFCASVGLRAQWQSLGPDETHVFSEIAVTDSAMLVLEKSPMGELFHRLFISWNDGTDWQPAGGADVFTIVATENVFLYTTYDGIYISRDHGKTWKPFNDGLTPDPSYGKVISLYVDGKSVYAGTYYYIFRIDDITRGDKWVPITTEEQGASSMIGFNNLLYGIYRHPYEDRQEIFYFKSKTIDLGGKPLTAWKKFPFPRKEWAGHNIQSITESQGHMILIPANSSIPLPAFRMVRGNNLYAVTHSEIFRSTDGEKTWQKVFADENFQAITVHKRDIYAITREGVIKANPLDGGKKQIRFSLPGNDITSIACVNDQVGVSTPAGAYLLASGGLEWSQMRSKIVGAPRNLVTLSKTLFGVTDLGIVKYTEQDQVWMSVTTNIAEDWRYVSLYVQGDRLYAVGRKGIHVSDDQGHTWTLFYKPPPETVVNEIAIGDNIVSVATASGLYMSRDGGKTWRAALAGKSAHDLKVINGLWTATIDNVVHVSPDSGDTWTARHNLPFVRILHVARDDGTVIISDGSRISMSRGGNNAWEEITFDPGHAISGIAISGGYLYVGTREYGVFRKRL
jgi:photosystem II stability/assembly factor-like uncharacterized protein